MASLSDTLRRHSTVVAGASRTVAPFGSRGRWWRIFLVLCLLLPVPATAWHRDHHDWQHKRSPEEVRGWAIINLVRFSAWPSRAFTDQYAPIKICSKPNVITLPNEPGALGSAIRRINGRRVVMRQIHNYEHLEGCHVLYLTAEDSGDLPYILDPIRDLPIALVSDAEGFAQNGGAFELIRNENTAFFKINAAALQQTGILLAQALMRLGLSRSHGSVP